MNNMIQLKLRLLRALIAVELTIAWLGFAPVAQAVTPAPDGGYPGGNTAEGQSALLSLTTGSFNTAVGFFSLRSDTTGSFNTAVGAGTLFANTGDQNTATGAGALFFSSGGFNTADGAFALFSNTTGAFNTADGGAALADNTTGSDNTANGGGTLFENTTGNQNTADGRQALLHNTSGSSNTALGFQAGLSATTGSNNVYIGAGMQGVVGESNACYIASIFGQTSANGVAVLINSSNKLGTAPSSKRFKENIKPMANVSEELYALEPVTFHYKKEIDPEGAQQLGLVAEDVEKVNADLVVRDKEGKAYSVRYDQVNAMLLNEFLKEHRKVEEQQKEIDLLKAELTEQRSLIQKVSDSVELKRSTPQVVANKP
jgi:hypothetical protein